MNKLTGLLAAAMLLLVSFVFANPEIQSINMNPANPGYGQAVTVTINYCASQYTDAYMDAAFSILPAKQAPGTNGQVFVISSSGIDVADEISGQPSGADIGWKSNTANGYVSPAPCTACGTDGQQYSQAYVLHVPPQYMFNGCQAPVQLYFHAAMKDADLLSSDWATGLPSSCGKDAMSLTWTVGTLPASFNIQKTADGSIQAIGDEILLSTNYTYWNGPFTITDNMPLPADFELVSFGPMSMAGGSVSAPAIGSTTGAFNWNFPDRTGMPGSASGTVWMLVKAKTAPAQGTTFTNYVNGKIGSITGYSSAPFTTGSAPASINLTQIPSSATASLGDAVTYTMDYSLNGTMLTAFEPFDNIATGSYSGTAPSGWTFWSETGDNGTWTVSDSCNNGDRIITADITGTNLYPAMIYNTPFTTGIVQSDFMINDGGYPGADASVIIRSNNLPYPQTSWYAFHASIDSVPASGFISIEKNEAGTITWHNGGVSSNVAGIVAGKWFTTKVLASVSGNDNVFMVKVWAKGSPEPAGWTITWTDAGAAADAVMRCDGLGNSTNWFPGLRLMRNVSGSTTDSYDNFMAIQPRSAANAVVYDTIPSGISYMGSSPAALKTGSLLSWNLGPSAPASGSFTWAGVNYNCGTYNNTAAMSAEGYFAPALSNMTGFNVPCGAGATSLTKTANPITQTQGYGSTTFTINYSNTSGAPIAGYKIWDTLPYGFNNPMGVTPVATVTANLIVWDLGTIAVGASGTVSFIGYPQATNNFHLVNEVTDSQGKKSSVDFYIPTATFTPSITSTPTITRTLPVTVQPTATSTRTATMTATRTNTMIMPVSHTPTFTASPVYTQAAMSGATGITKTASVPYLPYIPYLGLTYTINYQNNSANTISNYSIWDTIPSPLQIASVLDNGTQNGMVVSWNIGTLAPGATGSVRVSVNVIVSLNTMITNTAMDSVGAASTLLLPEPSPTVTRTITSTPSCTQTFTRTPAEMLPDSTPTRTMIIAVSNTPTFTATPTMADYYPNTINVVSVISSGGSCFVAGQDLTITINASHGAAWTTMNALVVASTGALDFSNNSGVADDCLWGLNGATGNPPDNTPSWQSQAQVVTGSSQGAKVTGYQMVVPVPASYAGSGSKVFWLIINTAAPTLTLGQYYQSPNFAVPVVLAECGLNNPPTFTPTTTQLILPATPGATATATHGCAGAEPVGFNVTAYYSPNTSSNILIEIKCSAQLVSAPKVKVVPHGNKPPVEFTASPAAGSPLVYNVSFPRNNGYGDIDLIIVTGTDQCGNTSVGSGKFDKKTIPVKVVWLYQNVFNPDKGESCRIGCAVCGQGKIKVSVYNRHGALVAELLNGNATGADQKEVIWEGLNKNKEKVSSGTYTVTVETDCYKTTRKVAVVR